MSNQQTFGGGGVTPPTNTFAAGSVNTNDPNGINVVTAGSSITYNLTNRAFGSSTTTDGSTTNIVNFTPPNTAGVYKLFIEVCAWVDATQTGSTYELSGAVKSDGLGGFLTIGSPVRIMNGESSTFDVSQVDVNISGGAINVVGTGIAATTIKWTGLINYVFGGA